MSTNISIIKPGLGSSFFFDFLTTFKSRQFLCSYAIIKIMTNEFHHVTVLLHETVDMLDIKPDGIYVDATLGGAGHSSYLLSQLSEKGHLYCFDQDQKAIDNAQVRLKDYIDSTLR